MNIVFPDQLDAGMGQAITILLEQGEKIHILHPQQIIAYRGPSKGRSDSLMNMKGMYRKKKLIQANFTGPCEIILALPTGFNIKPMHLTQRTNLLYDFKHLLFYTEGITMQTKILSMKNMLVTRDAVKVKFAGQGTIGLMTQGTVCDAVLDGQEPLFVDAGSLIAYPEDSKLELCVYGNHLASQHMSYQWRMTGIGSVLIQAGRQNYKLEREMHEDGIVKRFLREVIPFGGFFIK